MPSLSQYMRRMLGMSEYSRIKPRVKGGRFARQVLRRALREGRPIPALMHRQRGSKA